MHTITGIYLYEKRESTEHMMHSTLRMIENAHSRLPGVCLLPKGIDWCGWGSYLGEIGKVRKRKKREINVQKQICVRYFSRCVLYIHTQGNPPSTVEPHLLSTLLVSLWH